MEPESVVYLRDGDRVLTVTGRIIIATRGLLRRHGIDVTDSMQDQARAYFDRWEREQPMRSDDLRLAVMTNTEVIGVSCRQMYRAFLLFLASVVPIQRLSLWLQLKGERIQI